MQAPGGYGAPVAAFSEGYGAPVTAVSGGYEASGEYGAPGAAAEEYGAPDGAASDQAGYGTGRAGSLTKSGFPNYADRCGEGCEGEPEAEVSSQRGSIYGVVSINLRLEHFSREFSYCQQVCRIPSVKFGNFWTNRLSILM